MDHSINEMVSQGCDPTVCLSLMLTSLVGLGYHSNPVALCTTSLLDPDPMTYLASHTEGIKVWDRVREFKQRVQQARVYQQNRPRVFRIFR